MKQRALSTFWSFRKRGAFAWWKQVVSAFSQFWNVPLKRSGMHLATVVLVLLTVSLLINFINQVLQSAHLEEKQITLATEVAQLQAENLVLEGAVEYAESDMHVERVAREQLGYAREGDIVVLPQIILTTPTPTNTLPQVLPTPTPRPNWQRWWDAFSTGKR